MTNTSRNLKRWERHDCASCGTWACKCGHKMARRNRYCEVHRCPRCGSTSGMMLPLVHLDRGTAEEHDEFSRTHDANFPNDPLHWPLGTKRVPTMSLLVVIEVATSLSPDEVMDVVNWELGLKNPDGNEYNDTDVDVSAVEFLSAVDVTQPDTFRE